MEHIEIPAGERHPPFNWKVADATARLALVLASDELDCVALQLDTSELWRLVSIGPAVWSRVGAAADRIGQYAVAASAVSGHQAIALDSAGQAIYASADTLADALRVSGISTAAAVGGAEVFVQTQGVLDHGGWAWTPGTPVFLGLAGALVSSPPVSGTFVQIVGRALSPTKLLINLQPPIIL
jgi:hypothetical protein